MHLSNISLHTHTHTTAGFDRTSNEYVTQSLQRFVQVRAADWGGSILKGGLRGGTGLRGVGGRPLCLQHSAKVTVKSVHALVHLGGALDFTHQQQGNRCLLSAVSAMGIPHPLHKTDTHTHFLSLRAAPYRKLSENFFVLSTNVTLIYIFNQHHRKPIPPASSFISTHITQI